MNTVQIQCFLRVAETHSITRAAATLYMTQQSVSRQLALLEEEIGVPLLDRTTAFLTLTPAGQHYYSTLSTANRQLSILQQELAGERRQKGLRLRMGLSEWLSPFGPLKDAVDAIRQAHPNTVIELVQLDNESLTQWLTQGRLDLAFYSEGQFPHLRDLRAEVVAPGEMRLYAPEDVFAHVDQGALDRCWGLPLLMVPAWEWSFLEQKLVGDQEQAEFGLHPTRVLSLPNLHSMCSALRFGRCATVGDHRFGVFRQIPGLGSIPLPLKEHLLLARPVGQQHPLQEEVLELARGRLGGG